MGKLNTSHLIEAVAWVAIAALFFIYSFEFNQKIEIYKFGATAWPRSILLMLMLVIAGNLFYQRANGSTPQPGRVGISEDDLDDAEKPLSSYFNIGSFLFLPLIFAWSLKPVGFYAATPVFTALVMQTEAALQAPILKSPLYVPLCSKCGRALTFQNVACRSVC